MSDQRQLFDDTGGPAYTPYAKTDTSIEAAASVVPTAKGMRAQVLAAIRAAPRTDVELEHLLEMGGNTVRPRRRELQKAGLIRDSQERRPTPSGRKAIVWEAV